MKILRVLSLLALLATPVAAQDVSDRQLRQRLSFAISRAENAGDEVDAQLVHLRQLYADVHARIVADSLASIGSPPDTTTPPPPPPPPPSGVSPDMYKPAEWSDTIFYTTWEGEGAPQRFDAQWDQFTARPIQWLSWGGECLGGIVSGWQNAACNGLDSVQVGNQADPWVLEDYIGPGTAGSLGYAIPFGRSVQRLYLRYTIYHDPNFDWGTSSLKQFNLNGVDQDFLQLWYDAGPVWTSQSSPATEPCGYGLTANTWEDYYPGDVVGDQSECVDMGQGGFGKRGVWQHVWACLDFSRPAGQRVISYGVVDEQQQGIAAYHNNVTTYWKSGGPASSFSQFRWNGTYGGAKSNRSNYRYHGGLFIATGSSGSCMVPPSF